MKMIEIETNIRVRYADTDQMGFVYYANYLEWFEVGRTEFFRAIGIPYTEIEKKGLILPVIEAYLKFKKPAKYDQVIAIKTILKEIPKAKLKIFYIIYNDDNKDILVEGHTVHGFLNSEKKPVRIPLWIKNILENNYQHE